jgi:hypothetical protein
MLSDAAITNKPKMLAAYQKKVSIALKLYIRLQLCNSRTQVNDVTTVLNTARCQGRKKPKKLWMYSHQQVKGLGWN